MIKHTLPPGKKTMARKTKRTINWSRIKNFDYWPPINIVKPGFMTFNMVNICVQKKSQILRYLQNCHAWQNFLFHSSYVRKHVFLFLKMRWKSTSPAIRNNKLNKVVGQSKIWYRLISFNTGTCQVHFQSTWHLKSKSLLGSGVQVSILHGCLREGNIL